ncbi:MAG: carbohydrate-binding family 9-like protein [Daejeonella sp.]|uniref:carbohydrate-binding family 9-like protein n=1 Tax=Daejeonella sp. TaxID=2805397 RepID=UPI003C790E74
MIEQKHLVVPFLKTNEKTVLTETSGQLDAVQRHSISFVPWKAYSYKPEVEFAIGYSDYALLLKFFVSEKEVKAIYAKPNDPVYKDSCVELFISFEDEKEYYNFEFNCAGTCLLGFGKERNERLQLSDELIGRIRYQSVLKPSNCPEANISWELTLEIPLDVFHFHQIKTLKNKRARANVYKCGDDLLQPHFLAWNEIETEAPDFHRPEFFGSIEFS